MLLRTLIIAFILLFISSSAMAWDVDSLHYNATTDEMIVHYSFGPFEMLYTFFIGGGDYTKTITSEFVSGNYSIVEAGYSDAKIIVLGNITFAHPVNINVTYENGSYYLLNVTSFSPE